MVRRVDLERRRTGKRVGHIASCGQRTCDFGRGIGQDSIATKKIVAGWVFTRRSSGPVRRTHVPQATGRYPDHVLLDTVTQDLPRRKLLWLRLGMYTIPYKKNPVKKKTILLWTKKRKSLNQIIMQNIESHVYGV